MKKIFTNVFVVVFIFTLIISSISIQANDPLYEKYEYQEDFEYEDEIIGHALKAAVPKILLEYEARLRYRPMQVDVDSLAVQVEKWSSELVEAGYSEDEISEILINEIQKNLSRFTTYGSYKEERAEASGHGSGVVLSEDGYIATNAHVVEIDEQSKLMLYMNSLSSSVADDLFVMLQDAARYGVRFSEDDIQYLHEQLLYQASENAQVLNEKAVRKVCFAPSDGNSKMEMATIYDAELIEIGNQEGVDGYTKDAAILKIDAKNLVALPVSNSYPEVNSKIVSAGYPGVSEYLFAADDADPTVSVSVVTGTVTRLVDTVDDKYKAIAIDSTISNGNSGGPSVDTQLNIEGLNTYMSTADNRFAGMVPIAYVKSLTSKIDIGLGETSKTFLTGLQLLQQGYGPAALKCFEDVKNMQKNTSHIDHIISLAKEAPDKEHPADKDDPVTEQGFWEMLFATPLYLVLFIVACVLVLAIIIITIILICSSGSKKKKKKAEATAYSRSYTPITPVTPTAPAMIDDTLIHNNQNSEVSVQNNIQQQNVPPYNSYTDNLQEGVQPVVPSIDINQEYSSPQPEKTTSRLRSTMKKPSSDDLL